MPSNTVNITLRVPESLRATLEAKAKAAGHSMNAEINRLLERGLDREEMAAMVAAALRARD